MRWILGVCIYPLSINHSLVMIYHYMFYMYTCKHHSQVFICSSSFRSSILRFIVCGQNPLKHLKGQTIVLHTLCLCAHIPHSDLPWWVGPYQRKIYQISVYYTPLTKPFVIHRRHKWNSNAWYFSWHEVQKTLL